MQPQVTVDVQQSTLRKIRNRCVVPLLCAFVISYLDRVNVGFAAITANEDLGLTAAQYGWGAGLLFLGYSFFELPSNLALERFGARRWLARIMITWGLLGCGMALVTGRFPSTPCDSCSASPKRACSPVSSCISRTGCRRASARATSACSRSAFRSPA